MISWISVMVSAGNNNREGCCWSWSLSKLDKGSSSSSLATLHYCSIIRIRYFIRPHPSSVAFHRNAPTPLSPTHHHFEQWISFLLEVISKHKWSRVLPNYIPRFLTSLLWYLMIFNGAFVLLQIVSISNWMFIELWLFIIVIFHGLFGNGF